MLSNQPLESHFGAHNFVYTPASENQIQSFFMGLTETHYESSSDPYGGGSYSYEAKTISGERFDSLKFLLRKYSLANAGYELSDGVFRADVEKLFKVQQYFLADGFVVPDILFPQIVLYNLREVGRLLKVSIPSFLTAPNGNWSAPQEQLAAGQSEAYSPSSSEICQSLEAYRCHIVAVGKSLNLNELTCLKEKYSSSNVKDRGLLSLIGSDEKGWLPMHRQVVRSETAPFFWDTVNTGTGYFGYTKPEEVFRRDVTTLFESQQRLLEENIIVPALLVPSDVVSNLQEIGRLFRVPVPSFRITQDGKKSIAQNIVGPPNIQDTADLKLLLTQLNPFLAENSHLLRIRELIAPFFETGLCLGPDLMDEKAFVPLSDVRFHAPGGVNEFLKLFFSIMPSAQQAYPDLTNLAESYFNPKITRSGQKKAEDCNLRLSEARANYNKHLVSHLWDAYMSALKAQNITALLSAIGGELALFESEKSGVAQDLVPLDLQCKIMRACDSLRRMNENLLIKIVSSMSHVYCRMEELITYQQLSFVKKKEDRAVYRDWEFYKSFLSVDRLKELERNVKFNVGPGDLVVKQFADFRKSNPELFPRFTGSFADTLSFLGRVEARDPFTGAFVPVSTKLHEISLQTIEKFKEFSEKSSRLWIDSSLRYLWENYKARYSGMAVLRLILDLCRGYT